MDSNHNTLVARGEASFDFYPYNPNRPAGWVFMILFAIATSVHIAYLISYRSWFFIPFILGCIAETGGYYGRAWAHNNRRLSDPYVLQLFLIIGATPLLSASIYMSLSRVIRSLDATRSSFIRVNWISKIYIIIDILCLALQIAGTVMQAFGGSGAQRTAMKCVAGGLMAQLIAFLIFILLALRIHLQLIREPTAISAHRLVRWRKHFWVLYISSMLVLLRNLVRILEFLQGSNEYISNHELFLYAFDALPMFLVVLLFIAIYPGRLVRSTRQISKSIDNPELTHLTPAFPKSHD